MIYITLSLLRDLLRPRHDLLLENLALRQQILVLQRTNPKPPFRDRDRAFWIVLCHWWDGWRRPLRLVQPETVIRWHRTSWRMWWRWKSKPLQQPGRPRIPWEAPSIPPPKRPAPVRDARAPKIGTVLARDYKGHRITVRVIDGGYEWRGEVFKSLSAAAKAITGSHCSGNAFFGLTRKQERE